MGIVVQITAHAPPDPHTHGNKTPGDGSNSDALTSLTTDTDIQWQVLTGDDQWSKAAREWGLPPVALNKPRSREVNV
jgi:hypothetical protein